MTITLPLEPDKEAKLMALAEAKGLSTDDLLLAAIDKILAEVPETTSPREPTRSLRGLLAKYGPAPSAEEIDQNRAEMAGDLKAGFQRLQEQKFVQADHP